MKERVDFDGALKEIFEQDRPGLLERITNGVKLEAFLNVDKPRVQRRLVDLLLLLKDRSVLQIELQAKNVRGMPYRMLTYYGIVKEENEGRPLRQVVLYVGKEKLSMRDRLDDGRVRFAYEILDIRSIDAVELLNGNTGDIALAVLGGGGELRLPEILRKAARLKGGARDHVLAQILLLSGLRDVARRVEWELKHMGVVIDVRKNPVLMRWRREAIDEGRLEILRELLTSRFGALPKWAQDRLQNAATRDIDRWAKKVLTADTLEVALGKK